MTAEEFWGKYLKENILDIFDITCDFFSSEFPAGFLKGYDAGEVIIETIEKNVSAKEFDKALKFIDLIRDKHPDLYRENFQYIDGHLVDYYCFNGDAGKVEDAFANFKREPVHDYDMYFMSFKILLLYQYTDLLNRAIEENFNSVAGCDKLIGYPEYDLAICRLYMELEGFWEKESNVFPKDQLMMVLERYGFDLDGELMSTIEQDVFSDVFDRELLADTFTGDRTKFRFTFQWHFMKYMKTKGISFALSGRVFVKMLPYWESNIKKKKKGSLELYFDIKPGRFEKHFVGLAGDFIYDNKPEMVAVLWGCVYIYDFLLSIGLISRMVFEKFINESKRLKGIVIGQFSYDLWRYEFVHTWQRPDSVAETEFLEEQKIFRKSIEFRPAQFNDFQKHISEELENIGELSYFITEGGKGEETTLDLSAFEDVMNSYADDYNAFDESDMSGEPEAFDSFEESEEFDGVAGSEEDEDFASYEPVSSGPKIGRNEPCPCGSGKKYKKCCLNK